MSMGILIQILCSYVTLPLYALVTQMGSSMKPTIFNDRVATALRNWHHTAKKHVKQSKHSAAATPTSSRPVTPSHGASPIHLLRHYRSEMDSPEISPSKYSDNEGSPSPTRFHRRGDGLSPFDHHIELGNVEYEAEHHRASASSQVAPLPASDHHEIDVFGVASSNEFSFDKGAASREYR